MAVSRKMNFYHGDIIYPNQALIYKTAQMFTHYLSYHTGLQRTYHCYDLVLDTPKSKLFDNAPNHVNEEKVFKNESKLRAGLKNFMSSSFVKQNVTGGYVNFEHTTFRTDSHFAKFHPHVHLTLMLPSNKSLPSHQLSSLWSKCIHTPYNHFHAQPTYINTHSYHNCVKSYWPTLRREQQQLKHKQGNLIEQITTHHSNDKTMSALHGVNFALHHLPSDVVHYARPISDSDSHAQIMSAMMRLSRESNKKRATFVAYNHAMSNHSYHRANQIANVHHLSHAMGAVYIGLSRFKLQFPRHAYFGRFHNYAKKYLYTQFPSEAQADKIHYTESVPSLRHPNFRRSRSWQNIVQQVQHNFKHKRVQRYKSQQIHHTANHIFNRHSGITIN